MHGCSMLGKSLCLSRVKLFYCSALVLFASVELLFNVMKSELFK